jgi:pimeloyl-ACP methyl ester carboxylesterase
MKVFSKRDICVLLFGVLLMQVLSCGLINQFMFHPVKDGYDKLIDGYVDIGTNGISIAARLIGISKGKKVIIYCHGNAEDITSIDGRFDELIGKGYAIATFDYPGYGLSSGSPDEKGCYRNAHRLYDWLIHDRGYAAKDIVVVGYSIGTGVAIELAASREVGGLWLEAAYLSAPRVVTRVRLLPIDPFPNYERINDVKCPIVMLHGTDDSVIPYSHGRKLFDLAPNPKWFIPVDDASHSDFIDRMGPSKYEKTLFSFVSDGRLDLDMSAERD